MQLQSIHEGKDVLFFAFSLSNDSNLPYDPDFFRLYLKDRQRSKRSSVQEQDISPVYTDSLPQLKSRSESMFVIAVPKLMPLSSKVFRFDLFERGMGRNFSLEIKEKWILKAKRFSL